MSERLSTAGMTLQYAVETTKGVRPTTGYKEVPEVKSVPNFNEPPEVIDSTTLKETKRRTFVKGLSGSSNVLEFGANLTEDLIDFWDDLMTEYEEASANGLAMWFTVVYPKLTKSIYFVGEPADLGINDATVGGMLETTLYITPNSAPEMSDKPTV